MHLLYLKDSAGYRVDGSLGHEGADLFSSPRQALDSASHRTAGEKKKKKSISTSRLIWYRLYSSFLCEVLIKTGFEDSAVNGLLTCFAAWRGATCGYTGGERWRGWTESYQSSDTSVWKESEGSSGGADKSWKLSQTSDILVSLKMSSEKVIKQFLLLLNKA